MADFENSVPCSGSDEDHAAYLLQVTAKLTDLFEFIAAAPCDFTYVSAIVMTNNHVATTLSAMVIDMENREKDAQREERTRQTFGLS